MDDLQRDVHGKLMKHVFHAPPADQITLSSEPGYHKVDTAKTNKQWVGRMRVIRKRGVNTSQRILLVRNDVSTDHHANQLQYDDTMHVARGSVRGR
jgi:hypothetical protein